MDYFSNASNIIDIETVSAQVQKFQSPLYSYTGASETILSQFKSSAVLVPIYLQDGVPYVLLTKRSIKLRSHAGEVSLPGGMRDDSDKTEVETALREAEEEVGLMSSQVEVVGRLPPRVTRNRVVIYPVVGLIPPTFVPRPNPDEVDSVFALPLSRFLLDERHKAGHFPMGNGLTGIIHTFTDDVNEKTYKTWGLTANILIELAIVVLQKAPSFMFDAIVEVTREDPYASQHYFLEHVFDFPKSRL